MKYYKGINRNGKPYKGGAWVEENGTCAEQWNFMDCNGFCYGYVSTKSKNGKDYHLHIEKIDGIHKDANESPNVLVIWCAKEDRPDGKNLIVGWYKDATVLRNYDFNGRWPINIFAKTEDCTLLPLNQRRKVVPRKGKNGYTYGMGQANYWFADHDEEAEKYVKLIVKYISEYTGENWIKKYR